MKGRRLKNWEALKFMEDQMDGFIVSDGDKKHTWEELQAFFSIGALLSRCWHEYIEPPKPKTLVERFYDTIAPCVFDDRDEYFYYKCSEVDKFIDSIPERIDLAEAFAERFTPHILGRDVVLSWLKEMK